MPIAEAFFTCHDFQENVAFSLKKIRKNFGKFSGAHLGFFKKPDLLRHTDNLICLTDFDAQCDAWRETRVLLAGIPGHRLYNGGAIAIAPDGHLYLTTGWTGDRERPQDRASLAGKVLRMTLGVITHAAILH
jgi:hypothetical protein